MEIKLVWLLLCRIQTSDKNFHLTHFPLILLRQLFDANEKETIILSSVKKYFLLQSRKLSSYLLFCTSNQRALDETCRN
jgi:hypothetical protein